jgi:hypothetical protein
MTDHDHRPLSEHSMTILANVEMLVEELLQNKSVLPPEMFTRLNTYLADLAAAIESKQAKAMRALHAPVRTTAGSTGREGGTCSLCATSSRP